MSFQDEEPAGEVPRTTGSSPGWAPDGVACSHDAKRRVSMFAVSHAYPGSAGEGTPPDPPATTSPQAPAGGTGVSPVPSKTAGGTAGLSSSAEAAQTQAVSEPGCRRASAMDVACAGPTLLDKPAVPPGRDGRRLCRAHTAGQASSATRPASNNEPTSAGIGGDAKIETQMWKSHAVSGIFPCDGLARREGCFPLYRKPHCFLETNHDVYLSTPTHEV